MGSSASSSENPSVFQYTFTKVHGSPSVNNINDKLDWEITRMSLYQVPIDMIAHLARTAHYFLLFDITNNTETGHIVCHFTEDGVKHLDFHSSRSEAIFKTFETTYLVSKIELLRYRDVQGKLVNDLNAAFEMWTKPFNLILSNCRSFTGFIERKFMNLDNE
jgi:hypothetical protein